MRTWPAVAKSGHRSASPNMPLEKMDHQTSIANNMGLRQHRTHLDGTYHDLVFRQRALKNPSQPMAFAVATEMNQADVWRGHENGWYSMAIANRNGGREAVVYY